MPSYGKVDSVDLRTLQLCIKHWESTWGIVQGLIIAYNHSEEAKAAGCRRLVACTPWLFEDMPIPAQDVCENCSRWWLPLRKVDQNENSCARVSRSGQRKGHGRGKFFEKKYPIWVQKKYPIWMRSKHRKYDGRGRSRSPHFGRSRTPLRQPARSSAPLAKRGQPPVIGARA